MSTNTALLGKALKKLALLVFLFICSPIVLTMGFKAFKKYENTPNEHISYLLTTFAIILMIFTIYFAFKTFKLIVKAFFNND